MLRVKNYFIKQKALFIFKPNFFCVPVVFEHICDFLCFEQHFLSIFIPADL